MPDLPGAIPHLSLGYSTPSPIFITDQLKKAREAGRWLAPPEKKEKPELATGDLAADFEIDKAALWRRTVYPATEADHWFVSASAAYWKMLADMDKRS